MVWVVECCWRYIFNWQRIENVSDWFSTHKGHLIFKEVCLLSVFLGEKRVRFNPTALSLKKKYRWPANSPHKGPVTRKCFHLMTSSGYFFSLQANGVIEEAEDRFVQAGGDLVEVANDSANAKAIRKVSKIFEVGFLKPFSWKQTKFLNYISISMKYCLYGLIND